MDEKKSSQGIQKKIISYAFIDANNLILGLKHAEIKLDYKKFFIFLKNKYRVEKAFWVVGYRKEFLHIYSQLKKEGFILIFKKTTQRKNSPVKGNVDILLAVQSFRSIEKFDRFILVSGDGDFSDLLCFFQEKKKKIKIIIPYSKNFPKLFSPFEKDCLYLDSIKKIIEYKKSRE